MKTRNGKIARLPKDIREQLNHRIENGWRGARLVNWLNTLPEVKEILREQFQGRAITEQNLSQWREGGYADWLRHQDTQGQVRWMVERSDDVETAEGNEYLCERVARVAVAELAEQMHRLDAVTDPKERWERFREISLELWRLRNGTHFGRRVDLGWDQWLRELQQDQAAQEQEQQDTQVKQRESQEEYLERLMDLLHKPDLREWVRTDWPSREAEFLRLKEIYRLKPDSKGTEFHPAQHSRDALRRSAVYNYPEHSSK